jgi:sterol O-acyltransferase
MIKMKRPEDREAPSLELNHLQEPNISRSSGSENSSNEKVKPSYVSYKKQRQNVFTSRSSRLEREALQGALHEFRGFINLFWVCIGVLVCNTILHQFRERGQLIGLKLFQIMARDFGVFCFSDLLMVLSTFLCVPIVRLYADGWIKNKWIFYILQALFQLSFLIISTAWAMSREYFDIIIKYDKLRTREY